MARIDVSSQQPERKKIDTKSLIQSGAFAAIYFVLMFIIVMGSTVVSPALYLASPLTVGIITGTVYLLSVLKVKSIVPVIVMGVLFFFGAGGNSPVGAAITIAATVAACVILVVSKFRSKLMFCLSFVVYNLTMAAPFAMLATARDQFIGMVESYYGDAMVAQFEALTPDWIFPALVALALVGGALGALIGSRLVDKHFKRAGVL